MCRIIIPMSLVDFYVHIDRNISAYLWEILRKIHFLSQAVSSCYARGLNKIMAHYEQKK